MFARCFALLAFVAGLLSSNVACADEAKDLFDEARALMKKGEYAAACPKLQRSYDLSKGVGAQYNLAKCLENIGKMASAHEHYSMVATLSRQQNKLEREKVARERLQAIAPKVSHLRIRIAGGEVLGIRVDDEAIARERWAEPIPVDPGTYRVSALSAAGRFEKSVQVLEPGSEVVVEIPNLAETQVATPDAPPETGDQDEGATMVATGAIVAGIGAVGLIVGIATAAVAGSKKSEADDACGETTCPDRDALALNDEAGTFADASTASFVVGGVLAAAGITILIVALVGEDEGDSTELSVVPALAPGYVGIGASWQF